MEKEATLTDLILYTVGTCEDAYGDPIEVSVIEGDDIGEDGETFAVHVDGPASFTLDKAGRREFQRLFMEAERRVEAESGAPEAIAQAVTPGQVSE